MVATSFIIILLLKTVILGSLPVVSSQTDLEDNSNTIELSSKDSFEKLLYFPPVEFLTENNVSIDVSCWFQIDEKINNLTFNETYEIFTVKRFLKYEEDRNIPSKEYLVSLSFKSLNSSTNELNISAQNFYRSYSSAFHIPKSEMPFKNWIFFQAVQNYSSAQQLHRIILPNFEKKENLIENVITSKAYKYQFIPSEGYYHQINKQPRQLFVVMTQIQNKYIQLQENSYLINDYLSLNYIYPNYLYKQINGAFFSKCNYTGYQYEMTDSVQESIPFKSVLLNKNEKVTICVDQGIGKKKLGILITENMPCITDSQWKELFSNKYPGETDNNDCDHRA